MKPRIYLETTLFNYYFLKDPTRQAEIGINTPSEVIDDEEIS